MQTSFAGNIQSAIDYIKEQSLDEWGIIALDSSGVLVNNFSLETVEESRTLTDYEAYLVGALALKKPVGEVVKIIKNSQMENGKFSDMIDGTGEDLINSHIWGVISLYAAGVDSYNQDTAKEWLLSQQLSDGSFPIFVGDEYGSLDLTAMSLVALKCLGVDEYNLAVRNSFQYLEDNINNYESCEALSWIIISKIIYGQSGIAELEKKLMEYKKNDGFVHLKSHSKANYMASWHGILATTDYNNGYSFVDNLRNENAFKDLNSNVLYRDSIIELLNRKILSGYSDYTFKPTATITRGEISKVIVKAFELSLPNSSIGKVLFRDIENHWAKDLIVIAESNGLITGMGNNEFCPEKTIIGAEFATILVREKGLEEKAKLYKSINWYDGYVAVAKENGLLYNNFNPNREVTRAEVAESINKYISE
jgi:hypothetical protein